jgi:hypothetical protein
MTAGSAPMGWELPAGPSVAGPVAQPPVRRRALPVHVALIRAETPRSLLRRLAHANCLHPHALRDALPSCPRERWGPPDLSRLAALSGYPRGRLEKTLAAGDGDRDADRLLACRRCTARRAVYEPVEIRGGMTDAVCRRHRRWLCPATWRAEQPDLRLVPEVLGAHRRHLRMVGGDPNIRLNAIPDSAVAREAWRTAQHVLLRWTERGDWPEHRDRRLRRLVPFEHHRISAYHPLVPLANYPETVGLAGLLADQSWNRQLVEQGTSGLHRFCAAVQNRLHIPYEPYHGKDPLLYWIASRRRV